MATTRLIALHQRKGKSIAHSLGERTDYAKNPEKTEKGELVTGYACDPMTADEVSKSMLLFRDRGAETLDQINALVDRTVKKRDALQEQMSDSEKRLAEIATLKKHIINYSKTRSTYEAYRKAGYSKKFFEEHREEITLHKAAKKAFDELGIARIPKVKELSAEYAEVLTSKKQAYAEFRKVRDEAQELLIARQNLISFCNAEPQEEQQSKKAEKAR